MSQDVLKFSLKIMTVSLGGNSGDSCPEIHTMECISITAVISVHIPVAHL